MCPKCQVQNHRHPLFYDPEVEYYFHENNNIPYTECAFGENLYFSKENFNCGTIKSLIKKQNRRIIQSCDSRSLTVGIGKDEFLFFTWKKQCQILDAVVLSKFGESRIATYYDFEKALAKKVKKTKVKL